MLVAEAMGQARTSPKTLREIPCFASGEGSFMVLGIHRRPSLSLSLPPLPSTMGGSSDVTEAEHILSLVLVAALGPLRRGGKREKKTRKKKGKCTVPERGRD